jgi:glycosyltransferase involved in cell wall biosynthesis/SAM-dependent methyltransferase/spore maturation protein CgeB
MSDSNTAVATDKPIASAKSAAPAAAATATPTITAADVHDRVTEAYFGKLGDAFMRETQARIHWICERVEGPRVLDAGCSQGITTLLLAREGKQVLGVDVDTKAIEEARALLSQEPKRVQQCARLEHGDFLSLPAPDTLFDSLVMSEVLEHLIQPSAFIEAAPRHLKPGGRLVVTVPFGVNDFIDHKHTFYLLEPYRLLAARFDIDEVQVLGRWIGLTGRLRHEQASAPEVQALEARLVSHLEAGFEALERSIRQEAQGYRDKLHDANLKYRNVTEQVATFKQRLSTEESTRKQSDAAAQALEAKLKALHQELDTIGARHAEAERRLADLHSDSAGLSAARDRLAQELQASQVQLAHTQAQAEEMRQRIAAQDQQLQRWQQQIAEQMPQIAAQAAVQVQGFGQVQRDLLADLQNQRAAHAAEREQWGQQLAAMDRRRDEAAAQQLRTETELATLRTQHRFVQQQLEATSQALEELHNTAEGDRETSLTERKALEQRVDELMAELGHLRSQTEAAEAALSTATEDKEQLTLELTDLRAIRHTLEDQLRTSRSALLEQISLHTNEREDWQAELQHHAQLVADHEARLRHADGQLSALRVRLNEASVVLDDAQAQREHTGEQLQCTLSELQATRLQLSEQASQHSDEREEWYSELERQNRQVAELEAQVREASEQMAALQANLTNTTDALDQAQAQHDQTLLQLQDALTQIQASHEQAAGLEARIVSVQEELQQQQARLLALGSELDTERAIGRDHRLQKEKLQLQLLHAKRHGDELRAELERARQLRQAAEEQVVRTRSTFSFRLGYALLHGFKSFDAMRRLPGQLWALHQEGQQRRQQRKGAASALRAVAPVRPLALETSGTASPRHGLTVTASLLPRELPASEALRGLKVAAIMDEFTHASYAPECNLLSLSVDRWQEELQAFKPDMLFIESAWRGKDDRWGNKVGHLSAEVQGVLAWCREHKVPTAFWNKEDPIHFETFLNTARLFDHVFTTDIDCIPRYKAALEHDRVHLLPFACQPSLSNPIEQYERKDAFCFAGAYYVRYPERTRDLGNFVSHLAEYRSVEIYDRNFGKNDPNYQFPPEYQPFIVGTLPFDQIDKAYKGYRYAINLNSIKQSQSMFARRVFELLASNTLTISNFSRGVRTLFGELVVTSDSGPEIVRRLEALEANPQQADLVRLAGLRKVMLEHTYQDRLAFVVGHLQGRTPGVLLPKVTVTAYAKDQAQWDSLWANFSRQAYPHKQLLVVTPNDFQPERVEAAQAETVRVLKAADVADSLVSDWVDPHDWVAGMVPDDHYGRHYLTDLALATRYAASPLVGKGSHAVWSPTHGQQQRKDAAPYTRTNSLPARAALVHAPLVAELGLKEWATSLYTRQLEREGALSIDPFSYCKNGASAADQLTNLGDNLALDEGLSLTDVMATAEALPAQAAVADTAPTLKGGDWAQWFKPPHNKPWRCEVEGAHWWFHSELGDSKHDYLYASRDVTPGELGMDGQLNFHLDVSPGLNLQLVVLFLDANRQRISHAVKVANRNHELPIPAGTAFVRLGLRVYGSGSARVNALVLGHRPLQPGATLPRAEHLLLTNHYPSYDDLYRNGFVHSRVTAYRERGVAVDVFRLRADQPTSYHEYQNVDVVTGSQEALHRLLSTGKYKTVLVHFLDPAMWEVLRHHIDRIRVVVWVHGADIQSYQRRAFAYDTEQEHQVARTRSEERLAFWRELLQPMPANLKLVFVSRYLAETSMEDLGIRLPEDAYTIIPNPIDTDLFSYEPKPPELRKKILSIRPYTSRIYANDLSVAAILELSKEPFFHELEFRMIGDGKLFDSVLEPLRQFPNVIIERRFLTQQEIAQLHKEYGVFLCPTRMDTQGVSRDEAMASGLVPVTNPAGAVSEFVNESCSMLTIAEERDLASAIAEIFKNPELFAKISGEASLEINSKRSKLHTIDAEINQITQPTRETKNVNRTKSSEVVN